MLQLGRDRDDLRLDKLAHRRDDVLLEFGEAFGLA
jgi:hypothetical protein